MHCLFPALNADNYAAHRFHASERIWPETNCYVDVWIEVLSSLGTDPSAMLGFTLTQDFEGDQFTFFKVPLEDLESLYNIRVTELAIYGDVEKHLATQIERKRLCLVEVDGFYLPDTKGVGYQTEHGKTTIGINLLDVTKQRMEYFHNGGYFALEGEDYSGLFQHNLLPDALPFLPYSEFAKFPDILPSHDELRAKAKSLLSHHFARRPSTNPIKAFADVFEAQAQELMEQPFAAFHKYAFNTLRQFGANFELASSHLDWLSPQGAFQSAAKSALTLAETAKSCQFQLARAVTRKRTSNLVTSLEPAILAWDALMNDLAETLSS